jgi:hypothetical protein
MSRAALKQLTWDERNKCSWLGCPIADEKTPCEGCEQKRPALDPGALELAHVDDSDFAEALLRVQSSVRPAEYLRGIRFSLSQEASADPPQLGAPTAAELDQLLHAIERAKQADNPATLLGGAALAWHPAVLAEPSVIAALGDLARSLVPPLQGQAWNALLDTLRARGLDSQVIAAYERTLSSTREPASSLRSVQTEW